MTYLLSNGLYCTQLTWRLDVSWCRVPLLIAERTDIRPAEDELCRACEREIAWAHDRMRSTRDLRRGAA